LELEAGEAFTIFGVRSNEDRCPIFEWLQGLSSQERAAAVAVLKWVAANGTATNRVRSEGRDLWAFAPPGLRMPFFIRGNRIFITHGFKKKSKKWKQTDVERAHRVRDLHEDKK
jgi:phage-related protein